MTKKVEKSDGKIEEVEKSDEKIENVEKSDEKIPKGMVELKIKPHSTCLVMGRRGVGKSFISKFLIHKMLQQGIYDTFYLFSTTERYSKSFNCFPKECVIDGFDLKFIKELIKAQKKRIDKYGKESPKVASILLVFDDLLGSIQTGSHEMNYLNMLFSTSRHVNVGLLVISQSCKGLTGPVIRNNADLIIWRQINDNYLRSLYESVYWAGNLKSFMDFTKKSVQNTDFEMIAYDNMTTNDDQRWMLLLAEKVHFQIEMKSRRIKNTKEDKSKDDKKIKSKN